MHGRDEKCKILAEKPRCRWKDDRLNLKAIGQEGVGYIHLASG
jgi:hypothetical protein